ncbi:MAG: hypothetical protein AAF206_12485, partial [Bacteroidota bacterium]
EQTGAVSELGLFRIQVEFARKEGEQLYSLGYFEEQIEGKSMDVTGKHGHRIKKGITNCVEAFQQTDWKNIKGSIVESNQGPLNFNYTQLPKTGIYASFYQMAQGEPLMDSGYEVSKSSSKRYPKYTLRNDQGQKINKRITAFSDGENIYIHASRYSYSSHFSRVKHIGRYLYLEDRFSDPLAGVLFGLMGLAFSKAPKSVIMDTETGLVTVLREDNMKQVLDGYPDILERFKNSNQKLRDYEAAILSLNEAAGRN